MDTGLIMLLTVLILIMLLSVNWKYYWYLIKTKYLIRKAKKEVKRIEELKDKIEYR